MGAMPAVTDQLAEVQVVLTEDLLRRFDMPGPRYTSYPTADRFAENFGPADAARVLEARSQDSSSGPLSLYVHVPFCESLCYYCACNKIITKKHERGAAYLQSLAREVELYTALIGPDQPVTQLHLGGGSPTFLSDEELSQLITMLKRNFALAPGG